MNLKRFPGCENGGAVETAALKKKVNVETLKAVVVISTLGVGKIALSQSSKRRSANERLLHGI